MTSFQATAACDLSLLSEHLAAFALHSDGVFPFLIGPRDFGKRAGSTLKQTYDISKKFWCVRKVWRERSRGHLIYASQLEQDLVFFLPWINVYQYEII